jgi:hypothetical protein
MVSEYNAKITMRNQLDFYESTLPICSKSFPNIMPDIREYPGPIPELGLGVFLMPILSCTISGRGPQGQMVTVPCFSARELYLFLTVVMSILVVWSPSKKIKLQEFFQFVGAVIFGLWSYAIAAASSLGRNLDDDFFLLSDRVTSGQRVSDATTYLVLRIELSIRDYIGIAKL